MRTWITTIGTNPFAGINALWGVFKNDVSTKIDQVVVFYTIEMKQNLKIFKNWSEKIFLAYQDFSPEFVEVDFPGNDLKAFRKILKETIHKSKGKLILDMTSGRKPYCALMLLIGDLFPGKVEKVYYNFLNNEDFMDLPLPVIPQGMSQLYNMMES